MNEITPSRPLALKSNYFKIASIPLLDAWSDFILSRQAKQCTPQTLRNYQVLLGRFIHWLESEQGLSLIH
ncbi:MAG: hypothetical protein N3D16_04980, partial [Anaerolineales bacterium]|nr:hypothetical protein [Anaerolineales bacterium]